MSPIVPFSQQLQSFQTFEQQGMPLGGLVTPAVEPATSSQPSTPVQNTSLAGKILGGLLGSLPGTEALGTAAQASGGLTSTRFVAFGLGFLLVGGALLIFAFQGGEKGVEIVAGSKKRATALKEGVASLAA